MIFLDDGIVHHDGRFPDNEENDWVSGGWDAHRDGDALQVGETLGLLLDLDANTLAVYRNGKRLGIAVQWTEPPPLPLRWAVDLYDDDKIKIESKPAPAVSAERASDGDDDDDE